VTNSLDKWLVVLPPEATPPGWGTVGIDANGLYAEGLADSDFGRTYTWQQVLQRLADEFRPLAASTDTRLADLEQRVQGLTEALGGMALSATVQHHAERIAALETSMAHHDERAMYN